MLKITRSLRVSSIKPHTWSRTYNMPLSLTNSSKIVDGRKNETTISTNIKEVNASFLCACTDKYNSMKQRIERGKKNLLFKRLTVSRCERTLSKRAPSTLPRYKEEINASLRSQNTTLGPEDNIIKASSHAKPVN